MPKDGAEPESVAVACIDDSPCDGAGAAGEGAKAAAAAVQQQQQQAPLTRCAMLACCVGLASGISYGYEPPLVSGLVVMPTFMDRFFPDAGAGKRLSPYCRLSDPWVQIYIAGIFITALLASLVSGHAGQRFGRRAVIVTGALLLLAANVLQTSTKSLAQLVAGRAVMGLAQGTLTQAAPVYMAEAAPASKRALFGAMYSLAGSTGQLIGYVVNTAVGREADTEGGQPPWRTSFGALSPVSLLMLLLMAVLPDTPSSLLLRGYPEAAEKAFSRFRRSDDPGKDAEWRQICEEADSMLRQREAAALERRRRREAAGGRWRLPRPRVPALLARRNVPPLVITLHFTIVRVFCGFVTVMFLTSAILSGAGASTTLALVGQALVGCGNWTGAILAIPTLKKVSRAKLLPAAAAGMAALWAVFAAMLGAWLPDAPGARLSNAQSGGLIAVLVAWQVVYWISWSPAFWAVVGEVNPLETRATATGIAQATMSLAVFVILSQNLTMLCAMKWGMAVFFAAVCAYLGIFWHFFAVDTQSVPLHEIPSLWRHHWFWRRVVGDDTEGGGGGKAGGGEGGRAEEAGAGAFGQLSPAASLTLY